MERTKLIFLCAGFLLMPVFAHAQATNLPPTAANVSATAGEDMSATITLLGQNSDRSDAPLTYKVVAPPLHGTVSVSGSQALYVPNGNFSGSDTFTYTVNDGIGDGNTATVYIEVTPVNDAPVAYADAIRVFKDSGASMFSSFLANDLDVEDDDLLITAIGPAAHGSAVLVGTEQISYAPADGYVGTDSFSYSISDGNGGSATALVQVTIESANQPPALDPIGERTVNELALLTFTAHAVDPEGGEINYYISDAPSGASIDDSTGVFRWTPSEQQGPGTYRVFINATDGVSHAMRITTITVMEVPDATPPPAGGPPPAATPAPKPIAPKPSKSPVVRTEPSIEPTPDISPEPTQIASSSEELALQEPIEPLEPSGDAEVEIQASSLTASIGGLFSSSGGLITLVALSGLTGVMYLLRRKEII